MKSKKIDFEDLELFDRGPSQFDFGIIYHGQMDAEEQKFGRGTQYWPDGSIYEGYWADNVATGHGRLIHANGDYYEGEWSNDKTQGTGTYVHTDGSVYVGDWVED